MRTLCVTLALFGLVVGQDPKSLIDFCANPPKTAQAPLTDNFVLPEAYKISGSVTDWMKASTSLLVESATKEFRVLQRQSRDQYAERWVQRLTGEKDTMFINVTNAECTSNTAGAEIFNVSRFVSIVGAHTPSMYSIIQEVTGFAKTHKGFAVVEPVEIVGGVNAMKWIACVDGATAAESKVLLEVRYAGSGTIQPALSPFKNPLILSIRLAELPTFNSTLAVNHVSIELDRYELPDGDPEAVEHGIFCENRNTTSLPLKHLDEYAAVLTYFDHVANRSEVVEVLYSESRQVLIVAGNSFEKGVKILQAAEGMFHEGTDYILHDFKYGYEFRMSGGACGNMTTLTNNTADVDPEKNVTVSMYPMEELLVGGLKPAWNLYQSDIDEFGKGFRTFRTSDGIKSTVEVHLTDDGDVHSMAMYNMVDRNLTLSMAVARIPFEHSRLHEQAVQLSDCYDNGSSANNTWVVKIKDKKLSDLSQVGVSRLNEAVATSISQNVYPIIPYRVVVFYVETEEEGLSVIVRIAEKTATPPGNVTYNYTAELPTAEIFNLLNAAMAENKVPIEVEKVGGVKEKWMPDASTLRKFVPESDSGFVGYTGGSMFVLAIFTLLIGVSIGVGGVFFATRRQRISTLAYQVFE